MNVLLLLCFVSMAYGALLPPQKCKISDSECIKTVAGQLLPNFAKGDQELGIPVLDVLNIDKIRVNAIGLNLNFTDAKFEGFKNSVFEKVGINEKKKQLKIVFYTDLKLNAHYKASGRLVVLPISGDGLCNLQLTKLKIQLTAKYDDKVTNGQHFMELNGYKYTFQIVDNLKLHLSNLFDGNKFLSDNIHSFINENWRSIEQDLGRPTLDPAVQVIYEAIRTYLRSTPITELFEN